MPSLSSARTDEAAPQSPLPARFYQRSSTWGYLQSLPAGIVLLACAGGLASGDLAVRIVCMAGVALAGYRLTFVVHDCSHRTLFASRVENEIVGTIAAALLFVSLPVYRRLHWSHHLNYRRPNDPQGSDYNGLVPGRDRILWHLCKPLVLGTVADKVLAFFALQHAGLTRAEQNRTKPLAQLEATRARATSWVTIGCVQLGVALISTAGGTSPAGYVLYILPLVTIGLFLSRVRSYLEHGSLTQEDDRHLVARTHPSNWLERNLLSGLNFNYHNEHHRWPQVPSMHLPAVHHEVGASIVAESDYSPTYTASLRALTQACRRRNDG